MNTLLLTGASGEVGFETFGELLMRRDRYKLRILCLDRKLERKRLTKGQDSRKRLPPTAKRDALDKLKEAEHQQISGNCTVPRTENAFEYVSEMLKIPISNLRLWNKDSVKI